jgi:hypothetical protein
LKFALLGLIVAAVSHATQLADTVSCVGPWQSYPGGAQASCTPVDDHTGQPLGTLLASDTAVFKGFDGVAVGEIRSAVFQASDSSYHFYYQLNLYSSATEAIHISAVPWVDTAVTGKAAFQGR